MLLKKIYKIVLISKLSYFCKLWCSVQVEITVIDVRLYLQNPVKKSFIFFMWVKLYYRTVRTVGEKRKLMN